MDEFFPIIEPYDLVFQIVIRRKVMSLSSAIGYNTLSLLPANVKIAIFNANYRGDFGEGVAVKFKNSVTNGNWEAAVAAYLSHPDYSRSDTYKCYINDEHDVCKRFKFNTKQFRTMVKQTGETRSIRSDKAF